MAVDRAQLQQLIDEIPFTKAEDKAYFTNALLADESAAVQFIGQRLRHSDYTQKTTALSTKEKDLAAQANKSVQTYAAQLAEAQNQQRKIMDDLGAERISRARAETLLQKVKTVYQLSDEDIPKIDTATNQPKPGDAGLLDRATVEAMMKEHEQRILTQLQPINSFPRIPVLINEIQYEHQQLTGQRLPEKEILELMDVSSKENGPSLRGAWEQKYGIPDIRTTKQKEAWKAENRKEWEDEQTRLASEAALRGVRQGPDGRFQSLSPVMAKKFPEHVDSTNQAEIAARDAANKGMQTNGPKATGAERAAQKYMERRAQGIPLGQEAPVSKGGGQ